jgi:hypothetical protein
LILGHSAFDKQPSSVNPLLREWGGEAINFTLAAEEHESRLKQIGQPALVAVALPLSPGLSIDISPSVCSVFIGSLAGEKRSAGIFWRSGSLPANSIMGVYRPGDAEYDRFTRLTQT